MWSRTATIRALAVACALVSPPSAFAKESVEGQECFSTAQTRQKIAQHRLVDPFLATQHARNVEPGDAISERLCEVAGAYVYEIVLLRLDGRTVKVHVDASSGKAHQIHHEHEHPTAKGD